MQKRLTRDMNNRMIAGVCSGIARYLNIDPVIVRLLWAVSIFFFGTGILLYVICAIIMPAE